MIALQYLAAGVCGLLAALASRVSASIDEAREIAREDSSLIYATRS